MDMKKNQAKIDREKLKHQKAKIKLKQIKRQAKSKQKQEKKNLKLRNKRQKKLGSKVDNLITVIAILIFGSFAVVETLQKKKQEKQAEAEKESMEQIAADAEQVKV